MSTPTGARACSPATRLPPALRGWFAERDFIEVTANTLQISPGNEAHLSAFGTEFLHPDGSRRPYYLHTSPEFACKKLLAAGETRLFSLGPVYRNRERGPLHHPEFTMLEWYRAGEPYDVLMDDCAAFLALAAERAGAKKLTFSRARGRSSCRARAAQRRGGLRPLCRHRSAGDGERDGRDGRGRACMRRSMPPASALRRTTHGPTSTAA